MSLLFCLLFAVTPHDKQLQASLVTSQVAAPFAVAFDASNVAWFVEYQGHRLGMLNEQNQPFYLAGTGSKGDRDGQPGVSALNAPHNLAIAPSGDIYIADTFNHKIRKYDPKTKELTTFAGTGKPGFSGDDGPTQSASFNEAYHVALDPQGTHLYLADLKNNRIRRIDLKTQVVATVAGNGKKGAPVEGTMAKDSPLNDPRAVIVDDQGQLFILQRGGNDLWKVDTNGKLRRLAGTGKKGYSGDNGPAKDATLSGPKHLCFDQEGNILIADTDNHCIRLVKQKTGTIHLIAGRGTGPVPGKATDIRLNQPHGVTVEPKTHYIYIADSNNNRIVKLLPVQR
jgi:DNA-binding beta-propeller fold protein YncE